MDVFRPLYDTGVGGSEWLYILFQWMPHYQALGVKRKKKNISDTHMHTGCILIVLFPICMNCCLFLFFFLFFFSFFFRSLASKSWRRSSKTNPKLRKLIFTFSSRLSVLTYSGRILQRVSLLLKGRFFFLFFFFFLRKRTVSSLDQHEIGENTNNFALKPSQPPASNHSLHRFLSVVTVGHPSHGADLLVGPSAGERWRFFSRGCGAPR